MARGSPVLDPQRDLVGATPAGDAGVPPGSAAPTGRAIAACRPAFARRIRPTGQSTKTPSDGRAYRATSPSLGACAAERSARQS